MKVKTISRPKDFERETKFEVYRTMKNPDPVLHPFERQREYTAALNATKLSRMFAKPFLFQLATNDSCYALSVVNLNTIVSGSFDGQIRIWDLRTKQSKIKPQKSPIKDLCHYKDDVLSITTNEIFQFNIGNDRENIWTGEGLNSVDHHYSNNIFATASTIISIYDKTRMEPTSTITWGNFSTIQKVRFNKSEVNVLASLGSDNGITLYDIRTQSAVSKTIMKHRPNSVCWNPREPFNFVTGSEDHNCYSFDMRHLGNALVVHKGHVSAVLDVDFSPTGKEFVSGGYDKTVRIFGARDGTSRDIYHTKRMQRVFAVKFAEDSECVYSGSDDGSIRAWKARADSQFGIISKREKEKREYHEALRERFKSMPEINRIDRHRRVPKAISKATARKKIMLDSIKQKEENVRKHSKPGSVPYKSERKKHILTTTEK